MAGRTPGEAVDDFLDPFKETLGCITSEGFIARIRRDGGPYPAAFQRGVAVLRRSSGRPPIQLTVFHAYRIVRIEGERTSWAATTAGWIYRVLDAEGASILAFHWHPENSGRVTWPHLHAFGAHQSVDLGRLHPPTGRVSIESVVRFLIEDLGVVPRRADWPAILDRIEDLFRERRSWS